MYRIATKNLLTAVFFGNYLPELRFMYLTLHPKTRSVSISLQISVLDCIEGKIKRGV
jgi:hypothetical protein